MDHILLNLTLDATSTNNILLPNTPIAHIQVDFIDLVVPAMADPNSLHNSAMAVTLVFTLLFAYLVKERLSVRSMEDTLRRAKYAFGAGFGRRQS